MAETAHWKDLELCSRCDAEAVCTPTKHVSINGHVVPHCRLCPECMELSNAEPRKFFTSGAWPGLGDVALDVALEDLEWERRIRGECDAAKAEARARTRRWAIVAAASLAANAGLVAACLWLATR